MTGNLRDRELRRVRAASGCAAWRMKRDGIVRVRDSFERRDTAFNTP
jgi:hypothetical protein